MWNAAMIVFLLVDHQSVSAIIPREALEALLGGSSPNYKTELCYCVPFYQCKYENVIKTSKSCKTTEVCCKTGEPAEDICGWGITTENQGLDVTVDKGFQDVAYGEFPWIVAVVTVETKETPAESKYIGSGSRIHPSAVLTAAHKVYKFKNHPEMLKCRAGEWIRVKTEQGAPQERQVYKIEIHANYERKYTANDVALLFLTEEFDVSPLLRPVCVGKGTPSRGSRCFAMGWGRSLLTTTDSAEKLKKVAVSLVPRTVCWRALQAVDAARCVKREEIIKKRQSKSKGGELKARKCEKREKLMLHSTLMCAGGEEDEDTCTGDGGSPLVCQLQVNATHSRYAVYGLVAWGVGCGVAGAPGVYVDVAQFYDWITNYFAKPKLGDRSLIRFGRAANLYDI